MCYLTPLLCNFVLFVLSPFLIWCWHLTFFLFPNLQCCFPLHPVCIHSHFCCFIIFIWSFVAIFILSHYPLRCVPISPYVMSPQPLLLSAPYVLCCIACTFSPFSSNFWRQDEAIQSGGKTNLFYLIFYYHHFYWCQYWRILMQINIFIDRMSVFLHDIYFVCFLLSCINCFLYVVSHAYINCFLFS